MNCDSGSQRRAHIVNGSDNVRFGGTHPGVGGTHIVNGSDNLGCGGKHLGTVGNDLAGDSLYLRIG
jgi:hypothetical protein